MQSLTRSSTLGLEREESEIREAAATQIDLSVKTGNRRETSEKGHIQMAVVTMAAQEMVTKKQQMTAEEAAAALRGETEDAGAVQRRSMAVEQMKKRSSAGNACKQRLVTLTAEA